MATQTLPPPIRGQYRTNGERLFRVLRVKPTSVMVEDCMTLEWTKLMRNVVARMRVVREPGE